MMCLGHHDACVQLQIGGERGRESDKSAPVLKKWRWGEGKKGIRPWKCKTFHILHRQNKLSILNGRRWDNVEGTQGKQRS